MKKTILVTGGAGYVGSHTAYLLALNGYDVIVIDNLLHGQSFNHSWARLVKEDFADAKVLSDIFKNNQIYAVMHFASLIEIGESVIRPRDFYENNVVKTLKLLDIMLDHGVKKFIFSSSCAVYGNPIKETIDEDHPRAPINAYGKNKLAVEFALEDYYASYSLNYVALRYFNAAGAYPEMGLGEKHVPESHIIPLLLRAIINKEPFSIFGNDYESSDGTCVRDYIHVRDIANAHIKALEHIDKTKTSDCFNLGSGYGYTVSQLVSMAEKICEISAKTIISNRRIGDANTLVANPSKAMGILGWKPEFSDLEFILRSALKWEEYNMLELNRQPTVSS